MNIMEVGGDKTEIEYDLDLDQFRGEILGLNGSAGFYGKTPAGLRKAFRNSLKVFLSVCEEQSIESKESEPIGLHYRFAGTGSGYTPLYDESHLCFY